MGFFMRNLQRVKQFAQSSNSAFTEPSVRWLIFNEKENGLADAGAIVRVGRRVFIDVDRFYRWIDQQNAHAA